VTGVLVVLAKHPEPGRVKTRLCPPLSPEEAAALQSAMLDDVLEASWRHATALGLEPVLAIDPPEAVTRYRARLPEGFRVCAQQGSSLAARMQRVLDDELARGRGPVLLRGSDSPAMDQETLVEALAALERVDLVVSPDPDGGYNLIGLRRAAPGLLGHPMSTDSVMQDTLLSAHRLGLSSEQVSAGFDIDTAADLERLDRAVPPDSAGLYPRTMGWLAERAQCGLKKPAASAE
jgi:rSAM/selenodomain-associated transferase 1